MIGKILQNWLGLQNFVARVVCGIPPEIHHNIDKLAAIRKAFAYTSLEGIEGDYLEFGVFQGTSLVAAIYSYDKQNTHSYQGGKEKKVCRFFGFDSFEGFRVDPSQDTRHHLWKDKVLATDFIKVQKRIQKFSKKFDVQLIKGFYSDVIKTNSLEKLKIQKIRVCLIDCDLKSSTKDAITFSAKAWQAGTVLLIDDYFSYLANPNEGEAGAFRDFCEQHPEFRYKEFGTYGFCGVMWIVTHAPVFDHHPLNDWQAREKIRVTSCDI